jgi:hypothetical protein
MSSRDKVTAKTSLSRPRSSCILDLPAGGKLLRRASDLLKHRFLSYQNTAKSFLNLIPRAFLVNQKREDEFEGQVETSHSRHRLVAFWQAQKEENEFADPGYPLKHHYLDLAQIAFWDGQKAKMSSQCQSTA